MSQAGAEALPKELSAAEKAVFTRIAWRIMPLLILAYIINYVDRTNVGVAALTMNKELGLSATEFGFGAGILFAGYCVFEIPSNLALYTFGARRWLARIMVTWGLVSAATIFAEGPYSFYALRFVLGAAEAGFFPGVAFFLTLWFPAAYRARIYAWFLIGVPASSLIGSPISGMLLGLDGWLGLSGWKWLFVVEGMPAVIVGLIILWVLADTPETAPWLSAGEKRLVAARLASEIKEREKRHFWHSLGDVRVLTLAAIQFTFIVGSYGVGIFLPLIVKAQHFSNVQVGFITAVPSLIACVVMILWAQRVDRSGRKIFNLALTNILSFGGFVLAVATSDNFMMAMVGLTAVVVGTSTARGIFWTIPPRFLSGVGAAGGLALINTIGTIGGFVGPTLMGVAKDMTGSSNAGLLALSGFLAVSTVLTMSLKFFIKAE
jgi:ACS family tartrate transporter-like MFS transporter